MSGRFGVEAIGFRLFPSRTPEVEVAELEVIERAGKSAEPMPAIVSIEEAKRITSLSRETIYAFFFLFSVALLAIGQTTPPTLTILGVHQPSHGSTTVEFNYAGNTPTNLRTRVLPSGASCQNPSTGRVNYGICCGNLLDSRYYPYMPSNTYPPPRLKAPIAGLAPSTTYQLCLEISADHGQSYSTGTGISYTTPARPAVHPAEPLPPAQMNTTVPDTTGYTVVNPTCSTVQTELNNAQGRQLGTGTIINHPDCSHENLTLTQMAADAITFQPSNVNVANNTIGSVAYPGGSCGTGPTQVPCLAEGVGIRFASHDYYHNNPPANLSDNSQYGFRAIPYLFFVHFPTAGDTSNFQLFYPSPYSQCPTCLWALGSQGSSSNGNGYQFVEFIPTTVTNAGGRQTTQYSRPSSLKAIIVRTATPDAQFVPPGVRVDPTWDSKMTHLPFFTFGSQQDGYRTLIGNLWFIGLHTSIPDPEISSKPMTWASPLGHPASIIGLESSDGPITFDRCWIQGPPASSRISNAFYVDGIGISFLNSRIDQMIAWHASSIWEGIEPIGGAGVPNGPTSGTTFAIGPGEAHGGAFNYKQTGTMTIHLGGTPTNQSSLSRGIVYFDSTGAPKVAVPPGMESGSSTSIGTIVSGPTAYSNISDLTSPVLPQENTGGQNRPSVFPIAYFDVQPSGQLSYTNPANVRDSSCDWSGCEGSDTFQGGHGPGIFKFENNFFSWAGNGMNFDDCINGTGSCNMDIGDYTIRRNMYFHDFNGVRSSPNWDGNIRYHRQGMEWKHGSREWITGNQIVGPNGCDNQNPTGNSLLGKTPVGDVNDFNVEFNTLHQDCGFSGFGDYLNTGHLMADAMLRIRYANNLIYDTSGWNYNSYNSGYSSSAYLGGSSWMFQNNGPAEDVQVVHNTFMDWDGLKPAFMDMYDTIEGLKISNNLLWFNQNPGTSGMFIFDGGNSYDSANRGGYSDTAGNVPTLYSNCRTYGDKALLDCLMPNGYEMAGNVIIPGNNSSNVWAVNCIDANQNGGATGGPLCLSRSTMIANAQVSFSTTCTAMGGTVSGSTCTGGLASTNPVLNYAAGVPVARAALKFINPATTGSVDYHLRNDSPLISGGPYKGTDGKDVGADMEALFSAQGFVTLIGVPANSITSTSATVSWVAPDNQSCPVDLSSTDPTVVASFTRFPDTGTNRVRNVQLSGLQSGTTYHYRIDCAVNQPTGAFRTN